MNYANIRIEGAILSPDIFERPEDTPSQHGRRRARCGEH